MAVALHVRAWVEIRYPGDAGGHGPVALHVRAWVEIRILTLSLQTARCRPPCEGVGRNGVHPPLIVSANGRPPCEGVGRNKACFNCWNMLVVALHVRAWVEIWTVCQ